MAIETVASEASPISNESSEKLTSDSSSPSTNSSSSSGSSSKTASTCSDLSSSRISNENRSCVSLLAGVPVEVPESKTFTSAEKVSTVAGKETRTGSAVEGPDIRYLKVAPGISLMNCPS